MHFVNPGGVNNSRQKIRNISTCSATRPWPLFDTAIPKKKKQMSHLIGETNWEGTEDASAATLDTPSTQKRIL